MNINPKAFEENLRAVCRAQKPTTQKVGSDALKHWHELTSQTDEEAHADAVAFAATQSDYDKSKDRYSRQTDVMHEEELTEATARNCVGSVPDFTRKPLEASAEDIEAARRWVETL